MANYYQDNLKLIKKIYNLIEFETEELDVENTNPLTYQQDEKIWWLQSQGDMRLPISLWCNQFKDVSGDSFFVIYGLGHIGYVRELGRRYPENRIYIYEPCENILKCQMAQGDLSDVITSDKILIFAGKDRKKDFQDACNIAITYTSYPFMKMGAIPNYVKAFPEEYDVFSKSIEMNIKYEILTRNTKIHHEKYRGKSYLYNLSVLPKESGIDSLKEVFTENIVKSIPAVIISAGPSLDKNIDVLKEYKGRVFTICTDSAIKSALKHGVMPDMAICVDPQKDVTLFENEIGRNIPLISGLYMNWQITQVHRGRRFYHSSGEHFSETFMSTHGRQLTRLMSGGSVACNAFSLLKYLGFQTIILIGQDLAYPNNQLHAKDAYNNDTLDDIPDTHTFYVESIDGGEVLTEVNMTLYREWFEEQIQGFADLTVIDATEGGALIHGATNMKLREALEEHSADEVVRFEKLIESAEFYFDEMEQLKICNELEDIRESIPELVQKLEGYKTYFEEMDSLNRKGKYTTKQFKNCVEKIQECFDLADLDNRFFLLQLYANEQDYKVKDMLRQKEGDIYQEIKLVVESGIKMIDAYVNSSKKLMDEWEKVRRE